MEKEWVVGPSSGILSGISQMWEPPSSYLGYTDEMKKQNYDEQKTILPYVLNFAQRGGGIRGYITGGSMFDKAPTDPLELLSWVRSEGFKTKPFSSSHTTSNPVSAFARIIRKSQGWSTIGAEREEIARILQAAGMSKFQIANALNISSAHIEKEFESVGGHDYKIWRGSNLTPDLQLINQLAEDMGMLKHPTSQAEYNALAKTLIEKGGNNPYAQAGLAALKIINGGDYLNYSQERRDLLSNFVDKSGKSPIGVTGSIWRKILFGKAQTGGITPWVPGSGEGDRVPAMLEPGEFVVNKNAAKQYGGLLNHLNWNTAPRFAEGSGNRASRRAAEGKGSVDPRITIAEMQSTIETFSKYLQVLLKHLKK